MQYHHCEAWYRCYRFCQDKDCSGTVYTSFPPFWQVHCCLFCFLFSLRWSVSLGILCVYIIFASKPFQPNAGLPSWGKHFRWDSDLGLLVHCRSFNHLTMSYCANQYCVCLELHKVLTMLHDAYKVNQLTAHVHLTMVACLPSLCRQQSSLIWLINSLMQHLWQAQTSCQYVNKFEDRASLV